MGAPHIVKATSAVPRARMWTALEIVMAHGAELSAMALVVLVGAGVICAEPTRLGSTAQPDAMRKVVALVAAALAAQSLAKATSVAPRALVWTALEIVLAHGAELYAMV